MTTYDTLWQDRFITITRYEISFTMLCARSTLAVDDFIRLEKWHYATKHQNAIRETLAPFKRARVVRTEWCHNQTRPDIDSMQYEWRTWWEIDRTRWERLKRWLRAFPFRWQDMP